LIAEGRPPEQKKDVEKTVLRQVTNKSTDRHRPKKGRTLGIRGRAAVFLNSPGSGGGVFRNTWKQSDNRVVRPKARRSGKTERMKEVQNIKTSHEKF